MRIFRVLSIMLLSFLLVTPAFAEEAAVPDAWKEKVAEEFKDMDQDGDGKIVLEDFTFGIKFALGADGAPKDVIEEYVVFFEEMFSIADLNKDGYLTAEEYGSETAYKGIMALHAKKLEEHRKQSAND